VGDCPRVFLEEPQSVSVVICGVSVEAQTVTSHELLVEVSCPVVPSLFICRNPSPCIVCPSSVPLPTDLE
jgi:hypothetical protein